MRIERTWLEELIFAGEAPRRFTQDSPVLPDVWLAFGEVGDERSSRDLLITPYRNFATMDVVTEVRRELSSSDSGHEQPYGIACNDAVVAVHLTFDQLVKITMALTPWWGEHALRDGRKFTPNQVKTPIFARALVGALADLSWRQRKNEQVLQHPADRGQPPRSMKTIGGFRPGFLWFIRVVGTIALGLRSAPSPERVEDRLKIVRTLAWDFDGQVRIFQALLPRKVNSKPSVFLVSLNRPAFLAIDRSIPTIKAEAAIRLFNIRCNRICWAVVDSGVDATHPAFRRRDSKGKLLPIRQGEDPSAHSRVARTFDFTRVRSLLNPMVSEASYLKAIRKHLTTSIPKGGRCTGRKADLQQLDDASAAKKLRTLLLEGRALDWGLLASFLEVPHGKGYIPPTHDHGTHVAGILASDWRRSDFPESASMYPGDEDLVGVCPDIEIFDFRIFGDEATSDEFVIMSALQFIRWLNENGDQPVVHGVNLSLAIRHDVTNFACGRTPVCSESARLVNSGVVVVAAAGNEGRAEFTLASGGRSEGYRSISISDPGNTEEVITVGSTHRHQPHSYGVSYFSSRGPTGDGRSKPDLVAPGEKITAPVPQGVGTKDGTSMAAPHVSGAAALLLARHRELQGSPHRVKQILCRTATDLGRERYFQGAGLVDVLRAIQSV